MYSQYLVSEWGFHKNNPLSNLNNSIKLLTYKDFPCIGLREEIYIRSSKEIGSYLRDEKVRQGGWLQNTFALLRMDLS